MILQRTTLGHDGKPTLGTLTSRDGKFTCVTLERSVDGEHPCIPAGTYHCKIDWHHPLDLTHRYRVPELIDVPGRSEIQIHVANKASELLGCIAVGGRVGDDKQSIEMSWDAHRRLMTYLDGAALPFTLEVIDPQEC